MIEAGKMCFVNSIRNDNRHSGPDTLVISSGTLSALALAVVLLKDFSGVELDEHGAICFHLFQWNS